MSRANIFEWVLQYNKRKKKTVAFAKLQTRRSKLKFSSDYVRFRICIKINTLDDHDLVYTV